MQKDLHYILASSKRRYGLLNSPEVKQQYISNFLRFSLFVLLPRSKYCFTDPMPNA